MKKRFRNIAKGLSLTSMMFVFQACYGTPHDTEQDTHIYGVVLSDSTNTPIKNINVRLVNKQSGNVQNEQTDEKGEFSFYSGMANNYELNFRDIDSTVNNLYVAKDTIITNESTSIFVNIILENNNVHKN